MISLQGLSLINGEVYYIYYNRTWSLTGVTRGSEHGETIYSSTTHTIINDEIVEMGGSDMMIWNPLNNTVIGVITFIIIVLVIIVVLVYKKV